MTIALVRRMSKVKTGIKSNTRSPQISREAMVNGKPSSLRFLLAIGLFALLPGALTIAVVFSQMDSRLPFSQIGNVNLSPIPNQESQPTHTIDDQAVKQEDSENEDDDANEPIAFIATHSPEFHNTAYTSELILADQDGRVADEFTIPKELLPRVGFWFDAYTKYSSYDEVIHHSDYPWLVFDVVDTRHFYEAPRSGWKNAAAAQRFVTNRKSRIRKQLIRLAAKSPAQLKRVKGNQKQLLDLVKTLPGSLRRNLKDAANSLRVQLGQKNYIHMGLTRSRPYIEDMESIFAERGIPTDLTRLPFVESSFNTRAISKVGASGIWQFMPSVGRKFLRISGDIDERNSPLKSTAAAAKLLKQNYQILGSWELALTAYNHGPGGVMKASRKVRSKQLYKIISNYSSPTFSFASKNFYCEFLAALYAEKYHAEIFGDIPLYFHRDITSFKLERTMRPKQLASKVGLDLSELEEFNYDLKRAIQKNSKIPKGFEVFLPQKELGLNRKDSDKPPISNSEESDKVAGGNPSAS